MTSKTDKLTRPPRPPRKHNPDWADTKEARAARQARRRAALNELAQAHGFDTWDKLATAALAGTRIVLNAEGQAPQAE
jgi:hypothetical protein